MNKFHLSQVGYVFGCILIFALGAITLWYSYLDVSQQVRTETSSALLLESSSKGEIIEQTLRSSISDARFMYSTPPIAAIVREFENGTLSPSVKAEVSVWAERLEMLFVAYMENNPDIVQIRFIGRADEGRELIRVHKRNGEIEVVQGSNLQQKSERDYYQRVQTLPDNQLYISEITLNREYGKIEQPPWPTYRIAQPVYDNNQNFFGLVIINFNAQLLLSKLTQNKNSYIEIFLLNERGEYLLHPDSNQSFSFEYGNTKNWNDETKYIDEVAVGIDNFHTVVFEKENVIFNVVEYPVTLNISSHIPPLTVVAAINYEKMNGLIFQRYMTSVLSNLGLVIVAFILLTLYRLYSHVSFLRMKAQAEIEAIFQGSKDVIISIDINGNVDSWNHTAKTFFDVKDSQMRHINIEKIIKNDKALKLIRKQIEIVFDGGKSESLEIYMNSNENTEVVMSIAFSPVKIKSGDVSSVSAIFRDVTDASLLRKSLQSSNEKLESRNEEMQAFVYTVSHDLKSPLVTIGGFTDRILESSDNGINEKNRHRLERIKINVEHMAKLLSELLDLARIVRKKLKLDMCDLNYCVERAKQSLNESIINSNARFEIENGEQELKVNSQLLTQCLQNLFSNSISYRCVERPIVIHIKCYVENHFIYVSVSDNGLGIDKKYHNRIFKIFERLDVGSGSGVGLAIVKTIMEKHQGQVKVDSILGEGSTFTLCIPQHSEDELT
ncbi:ATP-binding protein [Alteromonas sp. 14N.309.X.WAT.G.H12]|uniref:ATP-binding protein n=1 Tax=Alteromonas sp. 14N.309.X.WAT.G.H12 TaxID=3120824 RepID=UPI002FD2D8FF